MWLGLSLCSELGTVGLVDGLDGGWEQVRVVTSGREGLAITPPPEVKSMACLWYSSSL